MRSVIPAFILSLAAFSASAANVRFSPPNPNSQTDVIAYVNTTCSVSSTSVERHGAIISITLHGPYPCPAGTLKEVAADLGVVPPGVYDVVVGPEMLLIGLAEGRLSVTDANAPFAVQPNAGSAGTTVHLTGSGLANAIKVRFGDQPATIVSVSDTDVVVKAPAHDPGAVDVTLERLTGETPTAHASFLYVDAGAPDPAFFTPVLFPVILNAPGSFGSHWRTELTVSTTVQSIPSLDPLLAVTANVPGGAVVYIPRQDERNVFFGALVRDLSRQEEQLGTELPVVREKDFFDRPFEILNVPTDARYRVALRLYRIDGGTSVHVRIVGALNSQPIVDTVESLVPGSGVASEAIGDLVQKFPQLAGNGPLRITVDSGTTYPGTWAFVSITNNQTEVVTIISPQ